MWQCKFQTTLPLRSKRIASGAGIVDQVSFIIMRRLGITEAFTNDEHFRAAGFVTLF
jgi:predicted nucleic acid-binding protein